MGSHISKQKSRREAVIAEKKKLAGLYTTSGDEFPGCDYHPKDRMNWMSELDPAKLVLRKIVFPGTHDSATDKIGFPLVSRPFAQCQSCSIYRQLVLGARVLDIRVNEKRRVCHGIISTYSFDVVLDGVKRFLAATQSEIIILEIRTEFGHDDPPDFDKYLVEQLGELLIQQDDAVFEKPVKDLLPRRVICVWKPRKVPPPKRGDLLWGNDYLCDNWIDTDLPLTKFESNMKHLGEQSPASVRNFFYRVENTVTPQADNPVLCVRPVTGRLRKYARLFVSQAFAKGLADRLQIFSVDFIDEDFVDACVGLTWARLEGQA
ncbi:PLC-like phosphodiesterases superfamily protein [Wolffia australiana]